MEGVLIAVALLACPLCMLVMGWMMRRQAADQDQPSADELRAERARLAAEIDRLERDGRSASPR